MKETPFPMRVERSLEQLEVVYTNICDPMRSDSKGGAKYFVTFIDDHSRYCKVSFIKRKNQVFPEFMKYKNMVET